MLFYRTLYSIISFAGNFNNQSGRQMMLNRHFLDFYLERRKNMTQKIDRRISRTKKRLRESLTTLMQEKPVQSITVREIAELADINRSTFYLHYQDVYDMVTQIQDDMFQEF